jgi:hypothetical protein
MKLRKRLAFVIFSLAPLVFSVSAENQTGTLITGHAQIEVRSEGTTFSAHCTADYVLRAPTCDANWCQAASEKAADRLSDLFARKEGLTLQPLQQCECSSGGTAKWPATCGELRGLAYQLCTHPPR